jgi:hypothetical protein
VIFYIVAYNSRVFFNLLTNLCFSTVTDSTDSVQRRLSDDKREKDMKVGEFSLIHVLLKLPEDAS